MLQLYFLDATNLQFSTVIMVSVVQKEALILRTTRFQIFQSIISVSIDRLYTSIFISLLSPTITNDIYITFLTTFLLYKKNNLTRKYQYIKYTTHQGMPHTASEILVNVSRGIEGLSTKSYIKGRG